MDSLVLIRDFSLIVGMAAVMAMVSRFTHIPLLLAYILGGILLNIPLMGQTIIHDTGTIQQLSELGVVFLMFYIGLEFDLKKLKQAFGSAILALIFQTTFMLILGQMMAPLFGWGGLSGLFLGGLLAISSTMITLPILSDQNALHKNFAQLAIGILVLEDILAILLLVILSGIAITGHFEWNAVGRVTFLVGAFVVTVFIIGRMLAPILIRALLKFNSEEVLTVVIVGILLSVGMLAEISHFSIALGAFLAGAIFSQTELSHAIESHTQPIRTLFVAIFFTSVGLLVHLPALFAEWKIILLLTFLTFGMKILSCQLGLFLGGQSGEDSFRAAVCKGQIGEFSFVIASLGISLNVTSSSLLDIAVGISIGTIICASFFSPRSEKYYQKLVHYMPKYLVIVGKFYRNLLFIIRTRLSQNKLLKLAKRPLIYIIISLLLYSAILIATAYINNLIQTFDFLEPWTHYIAYGIWLVAGLLSLPVLLPLVRQINVLLLILTENAVSKNSNLAKKSIGDNLQAIFESIIFVLILLFFGSIFISVASATLPKGTALYAFLGLLVIAGTLLWKRTINMNVRIQNRFIESFNQGIEEQLEQSRQLLLKKFQSQFPLKLQLVSVRIQNNCHGCGEKLSQLPLRTHFDASVVGIARGKVSSFSPNPETILFPGDELVILCHPEKIESIHAYFQEFLPEALLTSSHSEDFGLDQLCLGSSNIFVGKNLIESRLRQEYNINVVGIARQKSYIPLPSGKEILKAGDILMIVGSNDAIENFKKKCFS